MTIPALPAPQIPATAAPSAWTGDVRALLAFIRDTAPSIHGSVVPVTVSGTPAVADMSAAAWHGEIGAWTKTTTRINPPDPGRYLITISVQCSAQAAPVGGTSIWATVYLDATSTPVVVDAYRAKTIRHATEITYASTAFLAAINAGGGFAVNVLQNSGTGQGDQIEFNAVWLSA